MESRKATLLQAKNKNMELLYVHFTSSKKDKHLVTKNSIVSILSLTRVTAKWIPLGCGLLAKQKQHCDAAVRATEVHFEEKLGTSFFTSP